VSSGIAGGPGTALVWSMRGFIAALFRSKMIGKASVLLFFWLRFFDYVMPRDYSSDHASGVFFMGLKVDRQLAPSEIIEFYRGV
jgi:hypothetical protein